MPELTPSQHQKVRSMRLAGTWKKGDPLPFGQSQGQPTSPGAAPGIGQGPAGPPRGLIGGVRPPVSPSGPGNPSVNPGIGQGMPPGGMRQGMPPASPSAVPFQMGRYDKPQTYELATLMAGAQTGGLPPAGQLPVGLGGRAGNNDLMRRNQLQSQALAPQFG